MVGKSTQGISGPECAGLEQVSPPTSGSVHLGVSAPPIPISGVWACIPGGLPGWKFTVLGGHACSDISVCRISYGIHQGAQSFIITVHGQEVPKGHTTSDTAILQPSVDSLLQQRALGTFGDQNI